MSDDDELFAIYGTEYEETEEELKKGSTLLPKKPAAIQDQIATDDRGRRRFHGAFTGGYSAGHFNTVGTVEGWKPSTFRSTKDDRFSQNVQRPEDYMDDEDLGEFGISQRKIRQSDNFSQGQAVGEKRRLAWEHDASTTASLAQGLADIIRPVRESIGVQMLRAMGWREGRGIGMATTKQNRHRGGDNDDAAFDREKARSVGGSHELSLEDEVPTQLTGVEGTHGLGYTGLHATHVLDEKMGHKGSTYKEKKKGRGIRGQAFGVGVFEEDDDNIYTDFDMSQYDFALDPMAGRTGEMQKVDDTFEEAPKKLRPRTFYPPPRLPPNFRAEHRPEAIDEKKLPEAVQTAMKGLSVIQRAQLLGETQGSVMEMVGTKDRERLRNAVKREEPKEKGASRWDSKSRRGDERDSKRVEFPDEPMKQRRFREFIHYLKRGLGWPKPTDMSMWEWEAEKKDFEDKLSIEERAMLPEVRARQQPLAKTSMSLPIQELLRGKFVKETGASINPSNKDQDKQAAVKMGMFGPQTRTFYKWFPANLLCKRFNVPNPYPGADIVGCAHLQKTQKTETILNLGLPNTANELSMRSATSHDDMIFGEAAKVKQEVVDEPVDKVMNELKKEEENTKDEKTTALSRLSNELLSAIFAVDDSSDSENDENEKEEERETLKKKEENEKNTNRGAELSSEVKDDVRMDSLDVAPSTSHAAEQHEKAEDDLEYGPAPPKKENEAPEIAGFSVLRYLQEELEERKRKKREKSSKSRKDDKGDRKKKSKKQSKSHEKKRSRSKESSKSSKKEKKKKEKKDRRRSSTEEISSDSDVLPLD